MRTLKPLYVSSIIALALASCGTPKMISTPIENVDQQPLKITPLAENDLKRWSHLDLVKDTVPGMSVDKAYAELLKGKKSSTVIVGIVDSGVDIRHEDLQGQIWTNPKEIANNGKDDDNNGYIDDVHGWNFLGDSNNEQLEKTRIVAKGPGTPDYDKAKAELDADIADVMQTKQQIDMIVGADKDIKDFLKKDNFILKHNFAKCKKERSIFSTPLTLDDVLEDIYTFLDKHPSETVIFCAKKENRGI